jgi:hypothetical protein
MKMQAYSYSVLALLAVGHALAGEPATVAMAQAADSPLSLSIAVPPSEKGEHILDPSKLGSHFHVILSNRSDKPLKLWAPWTGPSHRCLSFEFTDEQGEKSKAEWEEYKDVSQKQVS